MKQLIRNILKEETDLKGKFISMIKELGIYNVSDIIGGHGRLAKKLFNDDPMEYLNLFNDLSKEEGKHYTIYKNDKGKNVFYIEKRSNMAYVSPSKIYDPLEDFFNLKTSFKKEELIRKWIRETYNRGVYDVWYDHFINAVDADD